MVSNLVIAPADLSQQFFLLCVSGETKHFHSFLRAIEASPCSRANHGGDYMQGQHGEKGTDKSPARLFMFEFVIALFNESIAVNMCIVKRQDI